MGQIALFIGGANTSCHRAVIRYGFTQVVAYHAVVILLTVATVAQIFVNHLIGILAIVIVGIEHCKGGIPDLLSGTPDSVACTPGLGALMRHSKAFGNFVKLLVGIPNFHRALFKPLAHGSHKVCPNGILNNNHCGFKTGFICIKQRVV